MTDYNFKLSEAAHKLNIKYKNLFTNTYKNNMLIGIDGIGIKIYLENKNNMSELPNEIDGYPIDIKIIGKITLA